MSKETKWTAGKWYADDYEIKAECCPIALAKVAVFNEGRANANLMAEAPAMYDLLDTFPGFTSTTAEKAAWAQRVIDVKRKARGE